MRVMPLITSLLALASTMGGGLIAARLRGRFRALDAFAAGVLIAVPLFDLLPESLRLAAQYAVPAARVLHVTAVGFLFIYILDRYISVHRVCEHDACTNVHHHQWGWIGASELAVHSFMDGLAIGAGFQLGQQTGIIITLAVVAHDFSDGINTVTVMLSAGNTRRSSLKMLAIDAVAPVLGALATLWLRVPPQVLVLILPFFGGSFLYLGASDLLPEAHQDSPPLVSVASCLAGFALIFTVTQLVGV
jgi:ZIP family zinc transporter